MNTPPTDSNALFHVEALAKVYHMGEVSVHALRDVSLDIDKGELMVILGQSGCGKSTLLNILGGIDTPTSGAVYFKGEDLAQYNERALTQYRRKHIGFVFQFYNLIPNLTAAENVEMATEISDNPMDAIDALGLVGLADRANSFPSQLSGGQQQRIAIARAVAKQPEVLLCDEPTGALDYATGKVVLKVLQEVNERTGTTVLLITHNASISGMAARTIHMQDGTVREIEVNDSPCTPEELEW